MVGHGRTRSGKIRLSKVGSGEIRRGLYWGGRGLSNRLNDILKLSLS
jgi:hypothetical protein